MKTMVPKFALITAAIIAATYLVSANSEGVARTSVGTTVNTATATSDSSTGASTLDDIDRLIRDTDAQIAKMPTSSSLDLLAKLLLSRGRITGDAASYANAETAARRSSAIAPRNLEAQSIHAEVLYSNHEFREAGELAGKIAASDPTQLGALAIRGDSLRELGDYAGASSIVGQLEKVAPRSPSVLVRRARLQVLKGDTTLAADSARRAEKAAQSSGLLGPTISFYSSFRGQIAFDAGDYPGALTHYRDALEIAENDRVATFGMARALAADGKAAEAKDILRTLTDRYPDPASLALLEDVYAATGEQTSARQTRELLQAIAGIARSNQQIYNRELAMYYANHDLRLDESLRLARAEVQNRKDVYAYDTLAWAQYKSGNVTAASSAAKQALATGLRDASVLYHAGLIAIASGDSPAGVNLLTDALTLNPSFDIKQAPLARAALAKARS